MPRTDNEFYFTINQKVRFVHDPLQVVGQFRPDVRGGRPDVGGHVRRRTDPVGAVVGHHHLPASIGLSLLVIVDDVGYGAPSADVR
jgi:hypothetical protein